MCEGGRDAIDFNNVCRLCLKGEGNNVPIFGRVPLDARIMACVSLEVLPDDGLPAIVCLTCLDVIDRWHVFRRKCYTSQALLNEWKNSPERVSQNKFITIKEELPDIGYTEEEFPNIDTEEEYPVVDTEEEYHDDDTEENFGPYRDESYVGEMVVDVKQEDVENTQEDVDNTLSENWLISDFPAENQLDPLTGFSGDNQADPPNPCKMEIPDVEQGSYDDCHMVSASPGPSYSRSSPPCSEFDIPEGALPTLSLETNQKKKRKKNPCKTEVPDVEQGSYDDYSVVSASSGPSYSRSSPPYSESDIPKRATLSQEINQIKKRKRNPCKIEIPDGRHSSYDDYNIVSASPGPSYSRSGTPCSEFDIPKRVSPTLSLETNQKKKKKRKKRLTPKKKRSRFSTGNSISSLPSENSLSENHLLKRRSLVLVNEEKRCTTCQKTYSSKSNLDRHIRLHNHTRLHNRIQQHECKNCLQDFPSEALYSSHIQDCPGKRMDNLNSSEVYGCFVCKDTFPSLPELKLHMPLHSKFKCPKCKKAFKGGIALSNHLRVHDNQRFQLHSCRLCLKSFSSIAALISHRKYHYSSKRDTGTKKVLSNTVVLKPTTINTTSSEKVPSGGGFKCTKCNKLVVSMSALERHMTSHSKIKLYSCLTCKLPMGYATSVQKHMREIHGIHVDIHTIKSQASSSRDQLEMLTDAKPSTSSVQVGTSKSAPQSYKCQYCGEDFSNRYMFEVHRKSVHSEGELHKCTQCSKTFPYKSYLIRHVQSKHADQNVYSCSTCSKPFSDLKSLNNHKGVHTRFNSYTCTTCQMTFNGNKTYRKHLQMHKRGLIYSCKLCRHQFASVSELYEHRKVHYKTKTYSCTSCDNSYSSSSALSKHKKKHDVSDSSNGNASHVHKVDRMKQHTSERVNCTICMKSYSCLSALKKHEKCHTSDRIQSSIVKIENKRKVVCPLCNREFPDHISLNRHKGWHTRRPESSLLPKEELAVNSHCPIDNPTEVAQNCKVCNKSFANSVSLGKHLQLHQPNKTEHEAIASASKMISDHKPKAVNSSRLFHKCTACPKKFSSKKALIAHRGWHSRLSNASVTFASSQMASTSAETVVVKNELKNFYCRICDKQFSSASTFDNHEHQSTFSVDAFSPASFPKTEMSLHACDTCPQTFECENYLLAHQQTHTEKRSYVCDQCPRVYPRNGSLWKHKQTHHPETSSCKTCGKTFTKAGSLKQHEKCHA